MGNPIGYDGAENLASMPFVENLHELRVSNCSLDDRALARLLQAEWPRLSKLSLWMNGFGTQAAKAFATNRSLVGLTELSVARSDIGPTVAGELGRASLPGIRELNADNNPLGSKGLRALLVGTLRTLHLDETEIDDDGAVALAQSPKAANLKWLRLEGNAITDLGARAIAESHHLAGVQALYLAKNKIGKKGREAIVARFGRRAHPGTG